jgi:hypothetical protein
MTNPADTRKPLGSPTTWLRKFEQGIQSGEVRVPCGECRACCKSPSLHVELQPREAERFKDVAVYEAGRGWLLAKRDDGACVHFVGGRCAVYEHRPLACRTYDCRLQALVGAPGLDTVMGEALAQWQPPRLPLPEDREALVALRMALADASQATGGAVAKALRWRDYLPQARAVLAALAPRNAEKGVRARRQ